MSSLLDTFLLSSSLSVGSPENPLTWILVLLILGVLIGSLYGIIKARSATSTPNNIATVKAQQSAVFETTFASEYKDKQSLRSAVQQQQVADRENCFINFQPLTVVHPGFLGPVKDGVYDEKEGVLALLRMGARCFVLPIDYHDKDTLPAAFPPANKPCLLYRDAGDTIRSLNGGSIAKVAQAIADGAWNDSVSQRNDPFVLVLYFVRTPTPNTKAYLDFLSQVAKDLAPLSPYLLGQTPEGVYNRQGRQDQLLFVTTSTLEKKLLVFCNADTTGFRTSTKDFNHSYLPKEDLDYWVHLRLYKQNAQTPLGVTETPEKSGIPRGLVETLSYFTTLPSDARTQKSAVDRTKERFTIVLSPPGEVPSAQTTKTLLDTYGVQAVALLLTESTPEVKATLANWKLAWRAKPKAIRYVRPEPQVIPAQSPKANAQGGKITIPS